MNDKNEDGSEKEITYGEYVEKINKRALVEQQAKVEAKRKGVITHHDED